MRRKPKLRLECLFPGVRLAGNHRAAIDQRRQRDCYAGRTVVRDRPGRLRLGIDDDGFGKLEPLDALKILEFLPDFRGRQRLRHHIRAIDADDLDRVERGVVGGDQKRALYRLQAGYPLVSDAKPEMLSEGDEPARLRVSAGFRAAFGRPRIDAELDGVLEAVNIHVDAGFGVRVDYCVSKVRHGGGAADLRQTA